MKLSKEVMQFEDGSFLISHNNNGLKTGGNLEIAKKINKKDIAKFEYLNYNFKIRKVIMEFKLQD